MFSPHSVHRDRWTSLDPYSSRIFSEDFCHDHHLTWKVNSITTSLSNIKFKEKINYYSSKDIRSSDQLKYWFPIENGNKFLYVRATNDYAKLHLDMGVKEVAGRKVNFYGSVGGSKNGTGKTVKLGVQNLEGRCSSDNRLKIDDASNVQWENRTFLRYSHWRLALLGVLNLNDMKLIKKDFAVGYSGYEYEVFLKGEQNWTRPTRNWRDITQWFSNFTLQGVWRRNFRERYALQVEFDPLASRLGDITALVEYNSSPNNSFKIKLNDSLNLSFVLKTVRSSQFTASFGASFPQTEKFKEASKVGLQIEANV